ncbi:Macrophage colony-stimulating factor 1 receptor [Sporothrix epigloea]|uniref:Macrophage colony-stimulating factor 1 receptor n=1 Tax=Sporothrix epigloea TaxID=1892477 RepID=A0ABP0DI28_9PEZI
MELDARAFKANGARFSVEFLAYMVTATLLALFFLLYFNRLFASLVSWALRTWTLHRYGVYIDIQAVQISLLGGRIFFVGFRYHGTNETILIQHGHITWAYWLRRVRHIDLGRRRAGKGLHAEDTASNDKVHRKSSSKTPCRLSVTLAGLEWFVYNRSAAYDSILTSLTDSCNDSEDDLPAKYEAIGDSEDRQQKLRRRRAKNESTQNRKSGGLSGGGDDPIAEKVAVFAEAMRGGDKTESGHGARSPSSSADGDCSDNTRRPSASVSESDSLPAFLQLLPIHFTCDRAAVVMGNENTSGILIIKAQVLSGEVDAKRVDTPDPYRQIFRLHYQKPVVEIRENDDYCEDQSSRAVREKQVAQDTTPPPPRSLFRHYRRTAYSQLRNLLPYFRRSVESFTSVDPRDQPISATSAHMKGSLQWQGLSRYLDGPDGNEKTRWTGTEYGMLNPILESPEAFLTMYWDSVGKVTASALSGLGNDSLRQPNINGNEAAPAWGIALSIRGGSVNYGPWADRKRAELQRVFFPGLSKDAKPARILPVGALRRPTQFKVYVELDEEVTLRVPVREASKNWRFKGEGTGTNFQSGRDKRKNRSRYKKSEPAPSAPGQRPYGWLDIKISSNATIAYCMDMVASATGFNTALTLDLPRVEISSSVNQQTLWRSGALRMSCDLSTPLQWNSLRQWHFHIASKDLELYLLRDHVYLLTDLIDDWGTGPPADYLVFTPFRYHVHLSFSNFKVFLNVNDANIINNPTSFDDNTFIILSSELLKASVTIPLDQFRPLSNAIPFSVQTDSVNVQLHVPPWNTQAMFVQDKTIGHLKNLLVEGRYHYYTATSPANTDTLLLNVSGKKPTFKAYGFIVRYFMKIKDNYFGDDVHFTTLEEYQDNLRLKEADPDAEQASRPPRKASNDFDVILSVHAEDPKILLPAYIYSASRHIQIDAASLAADLRFTNYYMDLDLVLAPLSLSLGAEKGDNGDKDVLDGSSDITLNTQLFIDGLHVFGNRLFGLPPTEPTYQCNWDLSIGAITGECTADFLTALVSGGKAFGFTLDNDENALIPYHSIVMYDITFLRVNIKSVSIWLHVKEAAFLLALREGLDLNYNDWARQHYSKRADIAIPDLQVSCVDAESALRHSSRPSLAVRADAFLKTSLSIAVVGRRFDFTNQRSLQQELVRREDQRTNRAAMLILPRFLDRSFIPEPDIPPAQPVPPVPIPVTVKDIEQDRNSITSRGSYRSIRRSPRRQRSQRSFLTVASTASQSSSSRGSVFRSDSGRPHQSRQSRDLQPEPLDKPLDSPGNLAASHRRNSLISRRSTDSNCTNEHDTPHRIKTVSHNTMNFSSKFFAPYFPLKDVKPDLAEAAIQHERDVYFGGMDAGNAPGLGEDFSSSIDGQTSTAFGLEDVDPDILGEDMQQSSTLIRVHNDVSVFLNPASTKHIAALIAALLPREPDDILDAAQISAIEGIVEAKRQREMSGRVQEISLQLPRAKFRFLNASFVLPGLSEDTASVSCEEQDQYDAQVSNLTFMMRDRTTWHDAMQPEESQMYRSFQLRLGGIEVSASERLTDVAVPQAAFVASIENVLVSLGTKDLAYMDVDIGAVEAQLSSENIEYIASLIHRTGVLASDLADAFTATLSYNNQIRPHLAQRLVAAGVGITDPGFLVRPSAVLRSANEHLRTFDSWKLAMRLRQIWFLMSPGPREELLRECRGHAPLLPVIASPLSSDVVAARGSTVRDVMIKLEHWRGWDLGDLRRSLFLQELFSSLKTDLRRKLAESRPAAAFLSVVRAGKMQLLLDPGPKQNEIKYIDLTVRFENGAAVSSSLPLPQPSSARTSSTEGEPISILNVFCSESSLRLNWEICELAQDVIRLYKRRMIDQAAADEKVGTQNTNDKANLRSDAKKAMSHNKTLHPPAPIGRLRTLHIVFAMDRGSLVLETLNLNVRVTSEYTRSSLVLRHSSNRHVASFNFITSCDSITSRIKSHAELVLSSQLQRPGIFVAHSVQRNKKGQDEHTLKATASSHKFLFAIKQDPLALLETLDLLVREELSQLYQLVNLFPLVPDASRISVQQQQQHPSKVPGKDNGSKIAKHLSAFSFRVALFLEEYTISVPLLRSLTYKISGVVARVAMAAHFGKEIMFDFDVKENSHEMQVMSNTKNATRSISLLQIPPTNGRVTTRMGEHEQTVSLSSSLELVQLDAAAVYSLLSALNRPEISSTIADMQQQGKVVQRHIKDILDSGSSENGQRPARKLSLEPSAPAANMAKPIVYSVQSTFAGLEIFGKVSPKSEEALPIAHLLFCLDSVRLEISNRLDSNGPVLAYPDLYLNLRRISFDILQGSEGKMASCGSMAFAALITATTKPGDDGQQRRAFDIRSNAFDVSLSPDTVSTVVDVLGYMGDKFNDLDTSRELEYLRKLRQSKPRIVINDQEEVDAADEGEEPDIIKSCLSSIVYTLEFRNIHVDWLCASAAAVSPTDKSQFSSMPADGSSSSSNSRDYEKEDLVLLLDRIELGTRTKNSAHLTIENLQLQLVPPAQDKKQRSANSALLPELIFNVAYFSTPRTRRFAFQAVGKSLDLHLTSEFIVPVAHLKDSIQLSIKNVQQVTRRWNPDSGNGTPSSSKSSDPGGTSSPSKTAEPASSPQTRSIFGKKRIESLLVDVDFAGAVVYIGERKMTSSIGQSLGTAATAFSLPSGDATGTGAGTARPRRSGTGGKYGQFSSDESGGSTTLWSPGLAWKLEYRDSDNGDPSVYAEVNIDPSSNVIYPSVVPLIMDLTASIKEVVSSSDAAPAQLSDEQNTARAEKDEKETDSAMALARLKPEESMLMSAANPGAMLGRLKLNLGVRIHKQQFSLSCQPIARVAATASFDDVYLTVNTIRTVEHGNFVAVSGNISRLQASVQHVYSRESTGSFEVDSIVLSLMNSKHVSGVSGVSALLKVSPMKVAINARQVQDFLLFREIWTPRDLRKASTAPISTHELPKESATTSASAAAAAAQQPVHLVQRYQQVAATAAFPWTASISIAALEINVDLGQALGKAVFAIEEFWVSSKKTSGWEQNLCLGFRRIGVNSKGRMSGFVALEDFRLRTSIEWPQREQALSKTPLIQASISFSQLRVKASFDYQAFLVADIRSLDFLMYNVRRGEDRGDRLVAVFEGDVVQVFGTTTSAAQGVALYQAFLRLAQERKASFETSLQDIEKFTHRRPSSSAAQRAAGGIGSIILDTAAKTAEAAMAAGSAVAEEDEDLFAKSPILLDTDVVVTLRAVNLGVFPNTFADHQVFKMEALDAQTHFMADVRNGRVHSNLGLTLGQLRIGLAAVRHIPMMTTAPDGPPKIISELSVEDVVLSATGSRGGTILKVPRVAASMQTWQQAKSRKIDYIFKSAFEGKVEVGWNYSRISYIRGMWANHSRTLEQTFGREIPLAGIRVSGVPKSIADDEAELGDGLSTGSGSKKDGSSGSQRGATEGKQTKITAEVNVPQSKYSYNALEPAIIETPQLRDMGEATPPLEWIGLHRDRLPNLTHQIVIVSLLELAGEVEVAYSRILGSS